MSLSIHKVSAGNGYTYLTKQVAANDEHRGRQSLADYYSERGEQPGVWWGSGLESLPTFGGMHLDTRAGSQVSEDQMRALFGEGLHPDSDVIQRAMIARGDTGAQAMKAVKLGRKYATYSNEIIPQPGLPGTGKDQQMPRSARSDFLNKVGAAYDRWRIENDCGEVPDEVQSRIRTQVATDSFQEQHGRLPTERELGGFIAEQMRLPKQSCAGYDLTFTPVKSVSLMWALSDLDTSRHIQSIHDRAVASTLEWIEDEHLYTREGTNGVLHTKTTGLIAALFTHRTSRAGDPNLHTHCAIANRVYSKDTGKWLTIDGEGIYQAIVAASERYTLTMESMLHDELGLEFTARTPRHVGRRPVREVAGISDEMIRHFSKRRSAITTKEAELVEDFRATHGRFPTPIEASKLAQTATLATRPAKTLAASFKEQRQYWADETSHVFGHEGLSQFTHNNQVSPIHALNRDRFEQLGKDGFVDYHATYGLLKVTESTAQFRSNHLYAEAARRVVDLDLTETERLGLVEDMVQAMLDRSVSLCRSDIATTPIELLQDGHSPSTRPRANLWTTQAVLDAEQSIIHAGLRLDGRTVRDVDLLIARTQASTDGVTLNGSQSMMVDTLAQSGRRLQLALAPAGTGKTTAMRVFADAWKSAGGNVVGFSHQAIAAQELRGALGDSPTGTLASLTYKLRGIDPELGQQNNEVPGEGSESLEWWKNQINESTMIVVDEAGMAGTLDLAALVEFGLDRGASITLVGDDRQLAAVGSGGILRDLRAEYGAVTLNELMRFTNPTEGEATIALRNGNHDALGWYTDHDRIRAVTEPVAVDAVFRDWVFDQETGADSIMLAATLDQIHDLNSVAQQWRRNHGFVESQVTTALSDEHYAGVGDVVVTRVNNYTMRVSRTDCVKNRDRWIVRNVLPDGSLDVTRADDPRLRTILSTEYVRSSVELGYAQTIHAAQGTTVDVARVLIGGNEDLAGLYVGMSRGRSMNQAYVVTGGETDPETSVFEEDARQQTAVEILRDIMNRSATSLSATTVKRENVNPFTQLFQDASVYTSTIARACHMIFTEDRVEEFTRFADQVMQERGYRPLSDEPAWDTLLNELVYRHVMSGEDPYELLISCIDERPLDERDRIEKARDYAAVLSWRLPSLRLYQDIAGPLSWLLPPPTITKSQNNVFEDPQQWNTLIETYRDLIVSEAHQISVDTSGWTRSTCPQWASVLIGHRELVASVAIWRAANQIPDSDLNPLGTQLPAMTVRLKQAHRQLAGQIEQVLHTHQWSELVPDNVARDPLWPSIITRLQDTIHTGRATREQLEQWINQELNTARALPVDQPASALWYRVVDHLDPIPQDLPEAPHSVLRPGWTPKLLQGIPADQHSVILTDMSWPALVSLMRSIPSNQQEAYLELCQGLVLSQDIPVTGLVPILTSTLKTILDQELASIASYEELPPDDIDIAHSVEDEEFLNRYVVEHGNSTSRNDIYSTINEEPAEDHVALPPPDPITADEFDDRFFSITEDYGPTSEKRIIELNTIAAEFYRDLFADSWASQYIKSRFDTDLSNDTRWGIGRAPQQWTSLIDHMRTLHVTDQELLDSGLAKWRTNRRGESFFSDFFRDQVTIEVRNQNNDVVGFIARANPATQNEHTPKYINTPSTRAYRKGEILFGAELVTSSTTPVIVEGPMDAIAVTLAGDGHAVGVAPSGTALTATQVSILQPHFAEDPVALVALDNDEAGWKAAEKAHDMLTSRGADPHRLRILGECKDPGDMYTNEREWFTQFLQYPDLNPGLAVSLTEREIARLVDRTNGNYYQAVGHIDLLFNHLVHPTMERIASLPSAAIDEQVHYFANTLSDLDQRVTESSPYHNYVRSSDEWAKHLASIASEIRLDYVPSRSYDSANDPWAAPEEQIQATPSFDLAAIQAIQGANLDLDNPGDEPSLLRNDEPELGF